MKFDGAKRMLSLALAIMTLLSGLLLPVSAEGTATISVGTYEAQVGETLTVTMSMENNPGIAGLIVTVKYDTGALELVETQKGTVFSDATVGKNIVFANTGNSTKNGTLATLTFRVLAAGEHTVECVVRECYNAEYGVVLVDSLNGSIAATDPNAGEEIPEAVRFASSMQAFLYLKSEVKLGVGYRIEGMEAYDPEMLSDRFGLLIWNADEVPAEAIYDNCDNVAQGAEYNAEEGRFESSSNGIAAKNLGDRLAFRVYYRNGDGSYSYSRLIEDYSPKIYCYNLIERESAAAVPNEEIIDLMVAILNYGAAAQAYFDYDVEHLMNAELTDAQKEIAWDGALIREDFSVPNGKDSALMSDSDKIVLRGASLNLLGAIDCNFYVLPSFAAASATIYYWTEAEIATLDSLTLDNASGRGAMVWSVENERWEAKYEGLPAREMFNTVYACMVLEDDGGNTYCSGVIGYSPERFSSIHCEDVDATTARLAKCIAIYGDAARAYFG